MPLMHLTPIVALNRHIRTAEGFTSLTNGRTVYEQPRSQPASTAAVSHLVRWDAQHVGHCLLMLHGGLHAQQTGSWYIVLVLVF